ncbi:motility protein A [Candidatus Magnetominusculus dajiuhuensis]|uniref:motility protein A n=1 Tax=Candidatus Magnetominusculus dajiuhuensis TaxID=3137712 RepID=UPI003B428C4F
MRVKNLTVVFVVGIVVALVVFSVFRGMEFSVLFNADALIIVVGGTIIGMLLGFPLERLNKTLKDIVKSFKDHTTKESLIEEILHIARINRNSGIRALERGLDEIGDDFLKFGANLIVNNYNEKTIREIMEREMASRIINQSFSQNVLKTLARLMPSLGLAGTVVSLIKMFKDFSSVETLAPLMAVALMSTFYGVVLANLAALPLCAKLKEGSIRSGSLMIIAIEGISAISNMEHPLKIEERLTGYEQTSDASLLTMSHKAFSGRNYKTVPAGGSIR